MSSTPLLRTSYFEMTEPKDRTTLYRLIEAGQLAHKALLVPLLDRGLEPGDDAVIFALHDSLGATDAKLADALGINSDQLAPRIERLIERDIVGRQAIGAELAPGLALTDRGDRMREVLAGNWQQLEDALLADLPDKQRKHLRKALKRLVELLRLS